MNYNQAKEKFCTEAVNNNLFNITREDAEEVFTALQIYWNKKPDKVPQYLSELMKPYLKAEHVISLN